jgi:hypothetical protein
MEEKVETELVVVDSDDEEGTIGAIAGMAVEEESAGNENEVVVVGSESRGGER